MELAYLELQQQENKLEYWLEQREELAATRQHVQEEYGEDVWYGAVNEKTEELLHDPETRVTLEELLTGKTPAEWTEDYVTDLHDHGITDPLKMKTAVGMRFGVEAFEDMEPDSAEWKRLQDLYDVEEELRENLDFDVEAFMPNYEKEQRKIKFNIHSAKNDVAHSLAQVLAAADQAETKEELLQWDSGSIEHVGKYTVLYTPQTVNAQQKESGQAGKPTSLSAYASSQLNVSIPLHQQEERFGARLKEVIAIYREEEHGAELAATVLTGEGDEGKIWVPSQQEMYDSATAFVESDAFRDGDWFEPGENHTIPREVGVPA